MLPADVHVHSEQFARERNNSGFVVIRLSRLEPNHALAQVNLRPRQPRNLAFARCSIDLPESSGRTFAARISPKNGFMLTRTKIRTIPLWLHSVASLCGFTLWLYSEAHRDPNVRRFELLNLLLTRARHLSGLTLAKADAEVSM